MFYFFFELYELIILSEPKGKYSIFLEIFRAFIFFKILLDQIKTRLYSLRDLIKDLVEMSIIDKLNGSSPLKFMK